MVLKANLQAPPSLPPGGTSMCTLDMAFPVSHVPTDLPGYNSVSGILGPCLSLLCLMQRLDFTTRSHKLKCYSIAGTYAGKVGGEGSHGEWWGLR